MQNDKVRRKENETTYLDPEAQMCPALVPVLSPLDPEAQMCLLCPVSCRPTLTRSLCLYDLSNSTRSDPGLNGTKLSNARQQTTAVSPTEFKSNTMIV